MCCNHTSTVKLAGGKLKQPRGSAYLLNQFISGHACSPPLQDTTAVHRQHHWNSQQILTSETPARLFCRNPACDSAWEYIFKSKSFRHHSLRKNPNKNPAPKQTVHFKPLFLLLFVFNCTRNELFWSTILEVLEKFCQVLEKHNVILKLQSDRLLLWENNHLLNDWAGGLNHCFTQAREGTAGARSGHCPNSMQATDFNNIWTSPHWWWKSQGIALHHLCLAWMWSLSWKHQDGSTAHLILSCYNVRLIPHSFIKKQLNPLVLFQSELDCALENTTQRQGTPSPEWAHGPDNNLDWSWRWDTKSSDRGFLALTEMGE